MFCLVLFRRDCFPRMFCLTPFQSGQLYIRLWKHCFVTRFMVNDKILLPPFLSFGPIMKAVTSYKRQKVGKSIQKGTTIKIVEVHHSTQHSTRTYFDNST